MDRIERIRQSFITRKTENTDTHDQIERHDPDFHKNKHKKNQDDWEDHDDDMTDISVESLIIFLQGLKKETLTPNDNEKKPVDQTMKRAMNAYGVKQPNIQKRYTYLDDDDQDFDPALVERLITALQDFQKKDILHITLLQGNGFLESIEKTVAKIQSL